VSAPTAPDEGALERGIAWLVPAQAPAGRPPDGVAERRSRDALSVLGREHDTLCRQACDPFEIAAGLEASGLNDTSVRGRYCFAGVFELAETLWQRVPWRAGHPVGLPAWPSMPLWRAQARGLTYVLPAAVAALAANQVPGLGGQVLLLAMTIVSITLGQALSLLGHLLVGTGRRPVAYALARLALAAAVAVTTTLGVALVAGGVSVAVAVAAASQVVFMVAATFLVVLGADLVLLAALVPGSVLCVLSATGAISAWLPVSTAGAVAVSVLVVVAGPCLALVAVAHRRGGEHSGVQGGVSAVRAALGPVETSLAALAAGYGFSVALCVSVPLFAARMGRVPATGTQVLIATLPLILTFGLAEYLLHRARHRCIAGSRRADRVRSFRSVARRELLTMVAVQGAVLVVLGCTAARLLTRVGSNPSVILYTAVYCVLGLVLLLTTTLMSFGCIAPAAAVTATAAAALGLPLLAGRADGPQLAAVQLVIAVVLFAVAYWRTATHFASTAVHR